MIGAPTARHPVVVVRAPAVDDRRGNAVRDWGSAQRVTVPGWAVDAGDTSDLGDGREGVAVSWTIRGPFAADVLASDRVELFGVEYVIAGEVMRVPGPSPVTSHTVVRLTRVEG